jgi:1-acyl-sn-glycerol-3-phosphate acyltransferase
LISDALVHRIQVAVRRLMELLFGMRVTGAGNVPVEGPLLVACNHISEMDPPVLACAMPRTLHFMAKKELFSNRLLDRFFRNVRAFPVDRGTADRQAIRTASDLLSSGEAVAIFPEGTRSVDGRQLAPRPGLGLLALSTGAPVLPVYVSGTDRLFLSVFQRPGFRVVFGSIIPGSEFIGYRGVKGGYATVSRLVMDAIQSLADATGPAARP